MLKIIGRSVAVFAVLSLALLASSERVLAQATCKVNGKEVPCGQLLQGSKGFLAVGAGIMLLFAVLGIAATVFWIMMIVHAASHPINDKAMWIILMVFTGVIGALIYYFVVKRKFNNSAIPPAPPRAV